jgi:hypothetical protein
MIVQWLDNTFPSWLLGVIIIGGGALLTWIAVAVRHGLARRAKKHGEHSASEADNDLTELFVLVVVTLYAILLAFMIFVVWTNFDRAEQLASTEGGLLTAMARQSIALPQPDQQELQLALRAYTESVMRDEWTTMSHSESSPVTTRLFNHLFVVAASLPATSTRDDISTELADLSEARTGLLLASGSALPDVFWFTLILGGVFAISLSVFYFTEIPRAHGLMAVAAAIVICTSLWLILIIDYPLSGDTAVKPDAFERALYVLSTIQSGQL